MTIIANVKIQDKYVICEDMYNSSNSMIKYISKFQYTVQHGEGTEKITTKVCLESCEPLFLHSVPPPHSRWLHGRFEERRVHPRNLVGKHLGIVQRDACTESPLPGLVEVPRLFSLRH